MLHAPSPEKLHMTSEAECSDPMDKQTFPVVVAPEFRSNIARHVFRRKLLALSLPATLQFAP
jgi:hypothetical protein